MEIRDRLPTRGFTDAVVVVVSVVVGGRRKKKRRTKSRWRKREVEIEHGDEEAEEEKDSRAPHSKIETAALTLRYKLSAS